MCDLVDLLKTEAYGSCTCLPDESHLESLLPELIFCLPSFMSDYEAWLELCDLYLMELDYVKAAYCMEELLMSNPHNHLYHQKYAEVRCQKEGVPPEICTGKGPEGRCKPEICRRKVYHLKYAQVKGQKEGVPPEICTGKVPEGRCTVKQELLARYLIQRARYLTEPFLSTCNS